MSVRDYVRKLGDLESRVRSALASGVRSGVDVLAASIRDEEAMFAAASMMTTLGGEERARYEGYRCRRARDEHSLGVALARLGIATLSGSTAESVRFQRSAGGKPRVAGLSTASGIRFNISHSGGLVLCALSRDSEVGVDVETCDRLGIEPAIEAQCFTAAELRQLEWSRTGERRYRALQQWTMKEAYLKATGTGLSRDPLSFAVREWSGGYQIEDPAVPVGSRPWTVRSCLDTDAAWSVVWRDDPGASVDVRLWRLSDGVSPGGSVVRFP